MIPLSVSSFVIAFASCQAPENPPVLQEPKWSSAAVEEIARESCFDCHSNETHWPFYTTWPLLGSLVQNDVAEGRSKLNFSEWNRAQEDADAVVGAIEDGEMPLPLYVFAHPGAGLNDEEKATLLKGIVDTYAQDPPGDDD